MKQLTPEQKAARTACWSQGVVASWYLRPSQMDIYDLILRERNPFIEAARRFGKTTSILAFVIEQLRAHPGWIARWCFPFKNQAREVLLEEFVKIQADCPESQRFLYQTTDSVFIGPGGSKCYIRGVNEDRGESARGPASNIVIADEYGFWKEPTYVIKSILLPQLEGQEGRWLIKASTPPEDLGHIYYEEKDQAQRKGRFIQKIIYDKETLSEAELIEIIDESGGADSPAFRRERLCEAVSDPELLVVPEFIDKIGEVEVTLKSGEKAKALGNVVPDDYERPEFFTPYVGGDSGADDNTALLFAYYDFQRTELVVEDEIVLSGLTTGKITLLAKVKEMELWSYDRSHDYAAMTKEIREKEEDQLKDLREKVDSLMVEFKPKPHKRVYDADKQLIFDLYGSYKYPMYMAEKADKKAAIHDLRVEVGARRFKVKERCTHLRKQLKVGLWKDHKKQDFHRSDSLGHLDAVAAAIYLNRCIDTRLNPIPPNHGVSRYTHHIPSHAISRGTTEDALARLMSSRARTRR